MAGPDADMSVPPPLARRLARVATFSLFAALFLLLFMLVPALHSMGDLGWSGAAAIWAGSTALELAVELMQWRAWRGFSWSR